MSYVTLRDGNSLPAEKVIEIYETLKCLEKIHRDAFIDLAMRCHDDLRHQVSQFYEDPSEILKDYRFIQNEMIPSKVKIVVNNCLKNLKNNRVDPETIGLQSPLRPRCCVIL
ncbi:MAG TPA: hypothetical protein VLF61_03790 [Rhabdochlamydiaceae bacterium]|nr:hypothetical protein [Rhabdochlamydiaceae bacterium]